MLFFIFSGIILFLESAPTSGVGHLPKPTGPGGVPKSGGSCPGSGESSPGLPLTSDVLPTSDRRVRSVGGSSPYADLRFGRNPLVRRE